MQLNRFCDITEVISTSSVQAFSMDKHGQPHVCIDEYMKRHLEIKLISSIVTKAETV